MHVVKQDGLPTYEIKRSIDMTLLLITIHIILGVRLRILA